MGVEIDHGEIDHGIERSYYGNGEAAWLWCDGMHKTWLLLPLLSLKESGYAKKDKVPTLDFSSPNFYTHLKEVFDQQ